MADNENRSVEDDPLPAPVDATKARAKFKNGILGVRVPPPEQRTERRTVRIET